MMFYNTVEVISPSATYSLYLRTLNNFQKCLKYISYYFFFNKQSFINQTKTITNNKMLLSTLLTAWLTLTDLLKITCMLS